MARKLWKTDDDLFTIVKKELFTCVVGDVMDKMRLQHQFLPPQIRPLRQDMVVIGRAMPVLAVDVFEERVAGTANKLMEKPFGLMLEALDDLHPNEMGVVRPGFRSALQGGRFSSPGRDWWRSRAPGNVAAGSSLKVFEEDPAYREFVLRVSLGKRNSPESIADAFVFLCSPLAAEINGQILSADYGGGIGNRL